MSPSRGFQGLDALTSPPYYTPYSTAPAAESPKTASRTSSNAASALSTTSASPTELATVMADVQQIGARSRGPAGAFGRHEAHRSVAVATVDSRVPFVDVVSAAVGGTVGASGAAAAGGECRFCPTAGIDDAAGRLLRHPFLPIDRRSADGDACAPGCRAAIDTGIHRGFAGAAIAPGRYGPLVSRYHAARRAIDFRGQCAGHSERGANRKRLGG